ncbi:DegV family protein [Mycolicibacterium neoaurum]|uniref:UDP-glucose 4-epimerase n=1 Tax=Mycolicibacterium neoaurum TaxID=1795 RepID=A0AAV2WHA0_MYCNE|nr:DegV family protein [Mycolicibacterium neoaurum]CDQ43307.1 UDP-glucose 4-epimerase [Mycolicibacterium neoaurum]
MRVLLTGAAGFIGNRIWARLTGAGHDVVAVDAMLGAAHREGAAPPPGCRRLDIRDADAVADILAGIDVVCHQAAVVGAGVDAADAPSYGSHNDYGTTVLLAQMYAAGCSRLVLASSMVVYGQGGYDCPEHGRVEPLARTREDLDSGVFDHRCPIGGEPLHWRLVDEDAPLKPRSLYAASKTAQEHYALAFNDSVGGSVVALRYHNVYGPGMPRDTPYSGVAAIFRSQLEAGGAPQVFEDGGQMRDFVHVDDVAAANLAAVEAAARAAIPRGHVFIVVDRLDNLRRSGRIGKGASWLGTALSLKPLLHLDVDGRLVLAQRVRTTSKAHAAMVDAIAAAVGERPATVAVHHVDNHDAAAALGAALTDRLPQLQGLTVTDMGAVLAVHVGGGAVGACVSLAD